MRSEHTTDTSLDRYLSGEKLYGDDFTLQQIRQWFEDEKEAYADLGAKDRESYSYEYHELNQFHLFRHLGESKFSSALGIGSAYGDEFFPIADRIQQLTVLEPSRAFSSGDEILGTPCEWVEPQESGDLPFDTGSFDLVTSLGALHHIPNVSRVLAECHRVLADGGIMLVREPIVSMGDWSKPRHGVTQHERGIPLKIFLDIAQGAGFEVQNRSLCVFPLIPRFAKLFGANAYNSRVLTRCDALLSNLLRWNTRYHATTSWQKVRPTALALVLSKG